MKTTLHHLRERRELHRASTCAMWWFTASTRAETLRLRCSPGWLDAGYGGAALQQNLLEQHSRAAIDTIDDIRVAMSHMVKTKEQSWITYAQSLEAAAKGHNVGAKYLITCLPADCPCNTRGRVAIGTPSMSAKPASSCNSFSSRMVSGLAALTAAPSRR
ncbi:hypothetical protein H257_03303 [Aphanomyces astaci]|uniref:Uncharacterized protein n=1 Tax=Aphanomyces astaci TaxID=112090 RepID=W4H141_APHAT|nr:hypothetical protein H257_03303 [Aphanomyces astaci]ETV85597.1 hypothetical protein H257_03303 [Aphanomyces astaci]|eukprot:XP_009825615.1 hypothetical protein H257_03303 [Aphanomyces astaci]